MMLFHETDRLIFLKKTWRIGARTDIQNDAKQTPYDLARDPEVGRLLRGAVGRWNYVSNKY